MKRLLSLFTLLFFAVSLSFGQSDAITKYFDQYVDDESFNVVYISPKMFDLVSKIEIEEMDGEIQEVIKELKGLRILNTDQNGKQYYAEAMSKINTSDFEILMTAREGAENIQFLVKDQGDIVNELLMVVGGEEEFTMISFVGNIDLKKVGKIAKALEIDGMNHLKKLDERHHEGHKKEEKKN